MANAMTLEPTADSAQIVTGPLRTCIVTGETMAPERMIRFVVGPSIDGGPGDVVPDLARRLPGRGMWLKAERAIVEQAVAKKAFARAARAAVKAAADLPERIEHLLLLRTLEDLARARRAGRAVAGFVKVEQMIGRRRVGLLVVANEADGDGLGKLQASGLPIERLGSVATWEACSDGNRLCMWRSRRTMRPARSFNELRAVRRGGVSIVRTAQVDGPPLTGRSGARTRSV